MLVEARETKELLKLERQLQKADLLIIDELSYLSFNRHQSELLFKVISDRAERSSVIISTNLEFSRWTELFENPTLITALVDRLTFRAHILNMNNPSYRMDKGYPASRNQGPCGSLIGDHSGSEIHDQVAQIFIDIRTRP